MTDRTKESKSADIKKDDTEKIEVKKSKYERVLSISNEEIIAKAIQDVLMREKENDSFRKSRKK